VTTQRRERTLRLACWSALVALGFVAWSIVDPRPAPVVLAMSLGQVLGTLSFAAFVFVVVADLSARERRARSG
jgi:hypothetical protein